MLDVRRMRVLKEVAARGSFSAAGQALSFTQSAVSQHIAALEREAGAQLVERTSRGVRVTEAGRVLVAHAEAILARLGDAEQELAAIAGLRGGALRLGCFPSAGSTLMPRAVSVFHARHPDVELSMVEEEPEASLPLLRRGDLDLALAFDWEGVAVPPLPEIERVPLFDEPMELVLPRDHPLADRDEVDLVDAADEAFICGTGPGSCNALLHRACREAGFEPRVAFETDDCLTAQSFVAAGVGLALLPHLGLSSLHPAVAVRPLAPRAPVRRAWAARPAQGYRSASSDAMLQILCDLSAEFPAAAVPALDRAGAVPVLP